MPGLSWHRSCLAACSLLIILFGGICIAAENSMKVSDLRCEYRVDPVGLDVAQPRLSWILLSEERGQRQSAYQILVASSAETLARNKADLWDSGKISSDQSSQVVYSGKSLTSRMRALWKVRAWDKNGSPTAWSAPAHWEMGLLNGSDWQALWIANPTSLTNASTNASGALPATVLRKEFNVSKPVRRAMLY